MNAAVHERHVHEAQLEGEFSHEIGLVGPTDDRGGQPCSKQASLDALLGFQRRRYAMHGRQIDDIVRGRDGRLCIQQCFSFSEGPRIIDQVGSVAGHLVCQTGCVGDGAGIAILLVGSVRCLDGDSLKEGHEVVPVPHVEVVIAIQGQFIFRVPGLPHQVQIQIDRAALHGEEAQRQDIAVVANLKRRINVPLAHV